jgi:hypothetical protein
MSTRDVRRAGPAPAAELSSLARAAAEVIELIIRILARCGIAREDFERIASGAWERIPVQWTARARRAKREMSGASHILTRWYHEVAYLDADGKPRALPLYGPRSVAALVRSVDPNLKVREALAYLVRGRAVRREGRHYLPRGRILFLRGARGPDYFRTLRVLSNMLCTLEHNVLPKRVASGWFEHHAENDQYPVSQLPQFHEYARSLGKAILPGVDVFMLHREQTRKADEPTASVGFGIYVWVNPPMKTGEEPAGSNAGAPKSGSASQERER